MRSPAAKQSAAASIGARRNCGGSTAGGESIQCLGAPTACMRSAPRSLASLFSVSRAAAKLHYRLLVICLGKEINQSQRLDLVTGLQCCQVAAQRDRITRDIDNL